MIAAAMLTFILLQFSSPCLVLQNEKGRVYASIPFDGEQEFAVSFIHSVNKTEVKEGYYIDNNGSIILDYCIYYGFGAGVATEVPEGGSLETLPDGSMLMSGFEMPIQHLSYVVGTVSDHILYINGEELSLSTLCGRNNTVRFSVKNKFIL